MSSTLYLPPTPLPCSLPFRFRFPFPFRLIAISLAVFHLPTDNFKLRTSVSSCISNNTRAITEIENSFKLFQHGCFHKIIRCVCVCWQLVLHYLHNKYLAIICYAVRKYKAPQAKLSEFRRNRRDITESSMTG